MPTCRREVIFIETKYEILEAIDKGDRQRKEIAQAFDIVLPHYVMTGARDRH